MVKANTVTKIFAIFAVLGILLIFALAYNLGGTKQAGKTEGIYSEAKERITLLQNQLTLCRDRNARIERGEHTAQDEIKDLENKITGIRQSKKSLLREEKSLKKELFDCEKRKDSDRIAATGTHESNPKGTYERLLAQYETFKHTLEEVQANRTSTRADMIRLIRSYRMDNMNLIKEGNKRGIDMRASGKLTSNFKSTLGDQNPSNPNPGAEQYKWNKNHMENFVNRAAIVAAQEEAKNHVKRMEETRKRGEALEKEEFERRDRKSAQNATTSSPVDTVNQTTAKADGDKVIPQQSK